MWELVREFVKLFELLCIAVVILLFTFMVLFAWFNSMFGG